MLLQIEATFKSTTDLLELVSLFYLCEDSLLGGFLHLAPQHKLVQDEVGLLEVEDDVQFAHRAKVLVQYLYVPEYSLAGAGGTIDNQIAIYTGYEACTCE